MRTVTLNNGVEMPILGFGVYQIPPEQTEQAVTEALQAGYRLLGRIAGLDTGASLFFDHRDPAVVAQLGNLRLTD
ncbi:hypothetical protein AB0K40_10950 [Nonomuraea bangladeshensis]|uniref:Aldo/keto reductase n=1 Tax=Nonomuraea bangladeshensis TaxID=404385 RepID=A0ABV3H0G4_9ACTN